MSWYTRPSSVLTVSAITVVTGLLTYAAYFDYRRRNDADFRKKLRVDKKRAERRAEKHEADRIQQEKNAHAVSPELILELYTRAQQDLQRVSHDMDQRGHFFSTVAAEGERFLQLGPASFPDAAVEFYKGLAIYAEPIQLINIYSQSLPSQVFILIMEMYNLDVTHKIHGYYDSFPPRTMNVSISRTGPSQSNNAGGQSRDQYLIAEKDFEVGDLIYSEEPTVAVLDLDVHSRGTHCMHCFHRVGPSPAVKLELDPIRPVYCSERCQARSKLHSENFLFGEGPPLPVLGEDAQSLEAKADRKEAQLRFVDFWRKTGHAGPLFVARYIALQIMSELLPLIPGGDRIREELPKSCSTDNYSVADHFERLRYVDVDVSEEEITMTKELFLSAVPGMTEFHTIDRHKLIRGKVAYNAIGVCVDGERDDKVRPSSETPFSHYKGCTSALSNKPEQAGYTRTPYGTSRQIGSGLYFVTSHILHSCEPNAKPTFKGTNELALIAEKSIKKGDPLTMAYVDVSQRTGESAEVARLRRRQELQHGWKFVCKCSRCKEEWKGADTHEVHPDGSKVEEVVTRHVGPGKGDSKSSSSEDID